MFSWINDVEVIRWFVIDAEDFPEVWHAWVKIWDRFYDPTFDDPVWATRDRNIYEYKYFNMPKDIFYTNRFDLNTLPKYLKSLSLEERKKIVLRNLYEISYKYKDQDFNLFNLINFKREFNIKNSEKITLENFWKILPMKTVSNFSFTKDWKKRQITKLNFFELENIDLENLLEQLNYDLEWKYFFKWIDKKWNTSYRLAHSIEFK